MRKIRRQNGGNLRQKEYPMILRNDVYDIQVTDNKLSRCWIKIPIHGARGGIKLPIRPHCEIEPDWKFREAKVIKRKEAGSST